MFFENSTLDGLMFCILFYLLFVIGFFVKISIMYYRDEEKTPLFKKIVLFSLLEPLDIFGFILIGRGLGELFNNNFNIGMAIITSSVLVFLLSKFMLNNYLPRRRELYKISKQTP